MPFFDFVQFDNHFASACSTDPLDGDCLERGGGRDIYSWSCDMPTEDGLMVNRIARTIRVDTDRMLENEGRRVVEGGGMGVRACSRAVASAARTTRVTTGWILGIDGSWAVKCSELWTWRV